MSNHIRALRIRQRLRQKDVAAAIGVSGHHLRKWERGLVEPPPSAMSALAKLFGVPELDLTRAHAAYAANTAPGEGYTTAIVDNSEVRQPSSQLPNGRLRVFDLFCGAGGLSFGLELTGRFTTIAGLDLLPDRIASFCANHPHAIGLTQDIRECPPEHLQVSSEDVDVVVGGPPCQGFSSIRPFRTLTERDKRNSLIEHFLLSVSLLKPRWFLFENVVGILTHANGRVLHSLLEGFAECGYETSWRVMNAALFGVPQNRERLVIIGHNSSAPFSWPEPTHQTHYKGMAGTRSEVIRTDPLFSHHLPNALSVDHAISDLPEVAAGTGCNDYATPAQNEYQCWARGSEPELSLHEATRHSKRMQEIISHAGSNISSIPKHLISSGFSSCYSRLDSDSPSTTLTVNFVHPASNRCIHPFQDRALTPREGARLQSFPDWFRFCGTRAQIVKQIGNAVPPLLAKALGHSIAQAEDDMLSSFENAPLEQAATLASNAIASKIEPVRE